MDQIAQCFKTDFARWDLEIPPELLASHQPGFIQSAGWLIQFKFGHNSHGEYLDYYASHRMAGDSHIRIHASGRRQRLAALDEFFINSPDPLENQRLEAAYYRRNRRIARQLAAKGFDKFTLNMFLQTSPVRRQDDPSTGRSR